MQGCNAKFRRERRGDVCMEEEPGQGQIIGTLHIVAWSWCSRYIRPNTPFLPSRVVHERTLYSQHPPPGNHIIAGLSYQRARKRHRVSTCTSFVKLQQFRAVNSPCARRSPSLQFWHLSSSMITVARLRKLSGRSRYSMQREKGFGIWIHLILASGTTKKLPVPSLLRYIKGIN